MKKRLLCLVISLFFLTQAGLLGCLSTNKRYEYVRDFTGLKSFTGIYRLNTYYECVMFGETHRFGNCFAYDDYVITVAHLAFDKPILADFSSIVGDVLSSKSTIFHDGKTIYCDTVFIDKTLDLAILKPESPLPEIPYPLGNSDDVTVGTEIAILGHPEGMFPMVNRSMVALEIVPAFFWEGISGFGELDSDKFFVVDCPVAPGDSGSPVVAFKNAVPEVIGLVSSAGSSGTKTTGFIAKINGIIKALEMLKGKDKMLDLNV